jgi:choice-of-anchor A domain-containing protein
LSLAALTSTGSYWDVVGSRVTFHAVADATGVAVFDLSPVDELLGYAEFAFDLGGASSVIFNSDISSGTIAANFLGGSAQAIASRVVWNFYNATSLTLNAQFGGSVLATQAALTNRNNVEGGVFVKTLNQQGEIHQGAYTGVLPAARQTTSSDVPEPASLGLVALALAACALARARRRPARQDPPDCAADGG